MTVHVWGSKSNCCGFMGTAIAEECMGSDLLVMLNALDHS